MKIPGPTEIRPLIPQRRGVWRTRDGKFELVEDPGIQRSMGIGPDSVSMTRHVWFIYPVRGQHPEVEDGLPVFVGGNRAWKSLRDAVGALEDGQRRGLPVDVEGA